VQKAFTQHLFDIAMPKNNKGFPCPVKEQKDRMRVVKNEYLTNCVASKEISFWYRQKAFATNL
jgi:hypothetical protein